MELLYVWIKKYKNIEEQGFNFSPKWRFHYDPETGKLDVEDRQDTVIDNFFGEHITNVTAIVGENGSGKSSLLEFVMKKFYSLTGFWDEPFIFITLQSGKLKAWKYADLKFSNGDIEVRNFKMKDTGDGFRGGMRGKNEFDAIHCVYYSNFYNGKHHFENDGRNNHFFDESTDGISHRLTKNQLESDKENRNPRHSYFYTELQSQIKFIGEGGNNIVRLKLPKYLKASPNYDAKSISMLWTFENKPSKDLSDAVTEIENHFRSKGLGNQVYASLLLPALYEAHSSTINGGELILGLNRRIKEEKDITYHSFEELGNISMATHSEIIKFVKWVEENLTDCYDSSKGEFLIPLSEKRAFEFINNIRYINYQFTLPFEYSWHFEDVDEDVSLSSGETSLLGFFSRLYSLKWQLLGRRPIFLFIDEGDLSYHPEWQRKLIKLLIESLPGLWGFGNIQKGKIQIILTTHSPFILSDLPKENVIFLKKGEGGKCQVVDGLNDMKQTFGANIHTLLSDGFFMDGLMGDFAKGKIDKVIKYLNGDKVENMDDDKAGKIIQMIGEPILKRHLQQQFQSKKQNKELEELKKRIEKLENERTQQL